MFQTVGYRVKHLLRVRVGNLRLGDLPRGHWRPLTQRELKDLEGRRPRSASQEQRPP
jgi:23S rRNA pseudouridine2604 synthase